MFTKHTSVDEAFAFYKPCCPEGWHGILHAAFEKIQEFTFDIYIDQIKEKFGSLCIYYGYDSENFNYDSEILLDNKKFVNLQRDIEFFERMSHYTCQACGTTRHEVKARNDGWVSTLCAPCAEKGKRTY